MQEYKKMREYNHEELVQIILNMNEAELLDFSSNYGGYPVLFRMSLDTRICHIPFIQTGAAVIIRNQDNQILLQERTDRNQWGLPGGCQELGEMLETTAVREVFEETGIKISVENIELIDTLSGNKRKNSYPNGDIVYNNTSLYLVDVKNSEIINMKGDCETKRLKFFSLDSLPSNLMDKDLFDSYRKHQSKKSS